MNAYLTVREEDEWNSFVRRSLNYEVYHLWQYHAIDQSGEPIMFVYQNEGLFIALPLIKREIIDSRWYDLTSVYGYGGPVSNLSMEAIPDNLILEFRQYFLQFMKEEECICVFSRLHPFLNQHHVIEKIGGVTGNGKTLYMDLSIPYEQQLGGYEKRMARQIRQLKRYGFEIRDDRSAGAIASFHQMYTENMIRVSASGNYFFSEEYFSNLLEKTKDNSMLLMVYDGGKATCGAIIFYSRQIVRNHLSATNADYLKESPSKLLTDYISIVGREKGAKYFHLGGGVGGKEDSLFKYKSYFSRLTIDDYIWRFIADNEAYTALVEMRGLSKVNQSDFFPLYRSKPAEVIE